MWSLRARGPQGQATIQVDATATFTALCAELERAVGVPAAKQEILAGFPPSRIQARSGCCSHAC
jgi:hypothetical protein